MNLVANAKIIIEKIKTSKTSQRQLLVASIIILLCFGGIYWLYNQRYVSTDDAYINANIVEIASRVSGQIAHINIENNQFVKQGDLLFQIDPEPFKVAATKARAQVLMSEAEWQNTSINTKRVLALVKVNAMPKQTKDDQTAKLQATFAALELAKAGLQQAELDLQYTQVRAATNGWVTNLTLREGNVVTANQPLFALVSNAEYWVDANLKETELQQVRVGQKAEITVDMYPHHIFKGEVVSISKGSGAAFSLLPPQNAVGNWVKVTQRVPVKIRVTNPEAQFPLRVGTTATVTIDTHS